MDIDTEPTPSSSFISNRRPIHLPVDDAHPFDLESYISAYTGRTVIERLIQIVRFCPSIAPQAFNLAVQHIYQSRDPSLYQTLLNEYEQLVGNPSVQERYGLPGTTDVEQLDSNWVDEVVHKNQTERVKLEVELKTYMNNMIKESIRMAHRDLGEFYRQLGEYSLSLKHHTKSREFCATSQHVLDLCLSVLALLIEQRNYTHLSTYVFKAEAALDAAAAAAGANQLIVNEVPLSGTTGGGSGTSGGDGTGTGTGSGGGGNGNGNAAALAAANAAAKKKVALEREMVQSRLDLATALSNLNQGNYETAAQSFLKLGSAKELGDWIGKLISQSDIAIYGTLCALATMSRSAIKAQILENSVFGLYIEQEPYVRELLEAYISSNFKTTLELLNKYSTRHYVDIHLSSHVFELTNLIKNRAIVLYFTPFASIKLERMSDAFGWNIETVEQNVVSLIQSGEIQGRVDSQNKILYAKKTDARTDLFARTLDAGKEMIKANRKVLLRMRLQQLDMVVKLPKGQPQFQYQDYYGANE